MVVHWLKMEKHPGRLWHAFVNGFGAVATGITMIVVLVAKFMAGAWVTALLVPVLIGLMMIGEAALHAGEAGDEGHDSAEPGEPGGADWW